MTFINIDDDSSVDGMYVKHCYEAGKFKAGDTILELPRFLIHSNLRTGWGKYSGQYMFDWDDQLGVSNKDKQQMKQDGYERAFSCWIYNKNIGQMLWQRWSKTEGKSLDAVLTAAFSKENKPENIDNMSMHVIYEGSEKKDFGMSSGYQAILTFVEWVQTPDDFKPLSHDQSDSANNSATKEKEPLISDEIPF